MLAATQKEKKLCSSTEIAVSRVTRSGNFTARGRIKVYMADLLWEAKLRTISRNFDLLSLVLNREEQLYGSKS
jgi:hypothetical protein